MVPPEGGLQIGLKCSRIVYMFCLFTVSRLQYSLAALHRAMPRIQNHCFKKSHKMWAIRKGVEKIIKERGGIRSELADGISFIK